MKKPFSISQKEKLILALLAGDITKALNLVCKVRGLKFHLNYLTKQPQLLVSRPGVEPETLMSFDTRSKRCFHHSPSNPDLYLAVDDLFSRLKNFEAHMILVAEKDKKSRRWAKLQVHVSGARKMAISVLYTPQGTEVVESEFEMP